MSRGKKSKGLLIGLMVGILMLNSMAVACSFETAKDVRLL